jgi:hypothetical protein
MKSKKQNDLKLSVNKKATVVFDNNETETNDLKISKNDPIKVIEKALKRGVFSETKNLYEK